MPDETTDPLTPEAEAEYRLTVLSPRALQSMGLIAYWAAWIDQSLDMVARSCLNMDTQSADVLLKGKTAGWLGDTIRGLVSSDRISADPRFDGLLDAIETALAALRRRNQILHGAMGGALGDEGEELVAVWKKDWSDSTILSSAEIDEVARALHVAYQGLSRYWWLDAR